MLFSCRSEEERAYFMLQVGTHHLGKSGEKLRVRIESGTEVDTQEESSLLARSPSLTHLPFNTAQTDLPQDGITHSDLGPSTSISN